MAFSVNFNQDALTAYYALAKTTRATAQAQLRLATQKKINAAGDDTSGYNVGKRLEAQNSRMKSQYSNIQSAKNLLSTSESALQQINDKLNEIQAKQMDAKDPMKNTASIADDIRTLANEIDSILKSTNINGSQLLASTDGSTAVTAPSYDVGGTALTFDFASSDLGSAALATAIGTGGLQSTTDATVIAASVSTVSNNVLAALGKIGNLQQSLESRASFLEASITNNESTLSNIFDADVAMEQLNSTKGLIAQQIGTAMLSQMNSNSQNLLSLFR
jgi:flagellin